MKRETKGAILTLFGGFCWGLSGSIGQFLFQNEGMDSNWLVPIRLGIAGVILLTISLVRFGKEDTIAPWSNSRDRLDLLIYGILGVSCCQYFYFLTIQQSNAGAATVLQDLSPVMILLVACILEKRKPHSFELFSILFALTGLTLIVTHGNLKSFAIPMRAVYTGILSAVCVTIYNVKPGQLLRKYSILTIQGWAFLLGGALFFVLFQPWNIAYTPTWIGYLGIAFVVVIGNVVAFVCYMNGVRMIGPSRAILYSFAEPVTAAILTTVFLGSSFTWFDAAGFACIFIMLCMISFGERKN